MNTEQIIQIARECTKSNNAYSELGLSATYHPFHIDELSQFAARVIELWIPNWQPIETAPRDGTEVLLGYYSDDCGEQQIVARWNSIQNTWCTPYTKLKSAGDYSPTHWMPLPKPPRSL